MPEAEVWTYAGQKMSGTKKHDVWITRDDLRLLFKAGRTVFAVGHQYTAQVTRAEEGVTLHGQPSYERPHPDSELAARLQAEYRVSYTRIRKDAIEKKAKTQPELQEALEPLLRIAGGMSAQDRDAFAMYVLRKIQGSWR